MKNRYCLLAFVLAFASPAIGQSQNHLPSSGSVGIGTNTPSGVPLHIAASSGGRSGVTLVQLEFKGFSSWFMSLGEIDSDSTGFALSTEGANQLSLRNDGKMTLNSLRGAGTRMLVADPNGVIGTQALAGPAGGDNLGNHRATANLNLQARDIVNVHGIRFDGQPSPVQTSASPWIYHNLPEGFRAGHRFLIGAGNIDPNYKLKVEGDAFATGMWISSDANIKTHITKLRDPLNTIMKMRGVAYDVTPDPTSSPYRTVGLIAQEVKEIFPEAVRRNADGQLSLNYNATVALLVEAVKQQQDTIRTQQRKIEQLERRIPKMESVPQ